MLAPRLLRHRGAVHAAFALAILVLGLVLRWDLDDDGIRGVVLLRTDENHYLDRVEEFASGDWSTDDFVNPTLYMYVLYGAVLAVGAVAVATGRYASWSAFLLDLRLDSGLGAHVGRGLTPRERRGGRPVRRARGLGPTLAVTHAAGQVARDVVSNASARHFVEVLLEVEVETFESCEGGIGHAYGEPTIRFHGERPEGFRALAAAIRAQLPVGELRRVWPVHDGEPTGPYWELTFTSPAH